MLFIDVLKDHIPYKCNVALAGVTWGFEFRYNQEYDFFTVDLLKGDELIVAGVKLVYGRPLFSGFAAMDKPAVDIIPLDISGNATRVGWEELGTSVFLWLAGDEVDDVI